MKLYSAAKIRALELNRFGAECFVFMIFLHGIDAPTTTC